MEELFDKPVYQMRTGKNISWVQSMKIVCPDMRYAPSYGTDGSAAMDLRIKTQNGETVEIAPNSSCTFGTGVQVSIPKGYVMIIHPRSSTGFKFHCMLANSTGVIDSDYRDEVRVKLFNYGDEPISFEDAQRVCQFYIIPIPRIELEFVEDNEEFRSGDRGGGIGSTGTK